MLTKEKIMHKIEENKETIKSYGVKKLVLFGSYARLESNQESDIDFLIKFKVNRGSFDDYIHLRQFLQDLLGKDIDLCEEELIREELKPHILGDERIEAKI